MHPFRYRRIDLYSCQRARLHWKRNWNFELGPKSTVRDNRTFSAATAARGLRFSEFFQRRFLQFGTLVSYIYNSTHVSARYISGNGFFRFFFFENDLPHCRSNACNKSADGATRMRVVPIDSKLNGLQIQVGRGSCDPRPGFQKHELPSKMTFLAKNRKIGSYRPVHCAIKLSAKGSLATHFIKSMSAHILASSKLGVTAWNFWEIDIFWFFFEKSTDPTHIQTILTQIYTSQTSLSFHHRI